MNEMLDRTWMVMHVNLIDTCMDDPNQSTHQLLVSAKHLAVVIWTSFYLW